MAEQPLDLESSSGFSATWPHCRDSSDGTDASSVCVCGCCGSAKTFSARTLLDDLDAIHRQRAADEMAHDCEILRNEGLGELSSSLRPRSMERSFARMETARPEMISSAIKTFGGCKAREIDLLALPVRRLTGSLRAEIAWHPHLGEQRPLSLLAARWTARLCRY